MARAHSVHLIRVYGTGRVIGAWTVKREMREWARKQQLAGKDISSWVHVQLRDGKPEEPTTEIFLT